MPRTRSIARARGLGHGRNIDISADALAELRKRSPKDSCGSGYAAARIVRDSFRRSLLVPAAVARMDAPTCNASGSTDSPSAVDPTTSQNSTVTTFRCALTDMSRG